MVWYYIQLYGLPFVVVCIVAAYMRKRESVAFVVASGVATAIAYVFWIKWAFPQMFYESPYWLAGMSVLIVVLVLLLGALAPYPEDEEEEAFG